LYDRQIVMRHRGRFDKRFRQANRGGGILRGGGPNTSTGAYVITPMKLLLNPSEGAGGSITTEKEIIVLVNRGWISAQRVEAELAKASTSSAAASSSSSSNGGKKVKAPLPPRPEEEVVEVLDAVLRKPEKQIRFITPDNVPADGKWNYRNIAEMAAHCGTMPVFLDAVYAEKEPSESGGGGGSGSPSAHPAATSVAAASEPEPIGGQTNLALRNEHMHYLCFWYTLSGLSFVVWCVPLFGIAVT